MAATNYTPIQLYFSTTASAVPLAANLAQGELAINITDGKLYYEDNGGVVQVIATKGTGTIGGSTTQIQYNNAGALAGNAAMVFNNSTNVTTLTTLNLTNVLGAIYGGTAQSTYTQGDVLYASAANTLSKLGIGTVNYILTSSGSVPQWSAPSSISVLTATNLDGGAAGSVPYQSGVATTTFLAIGAANRVMTSTGSAPQWVTSLTGLTGVSSSSITNTSLTSGRVVVSTTAGLQADDADLTFDGTTLSAGGFSTVGLSTLVKTVKIGDSSFNGVAVFAAATPAKLYMGTGTVTDVTSAISATNAIGAIASLGITPIAATNTSVTYTDAATLYIAGAPSAGTNVTLTNPYSLYVAAGAAYFGGAVTVAGSLSLAAVTVTSLTDSGLTSGRVTYAGTGGLLQDSANLTFNGTTLTANTIGAFTLGGTIAGGGNQINNVVIGTTTPLAGSFTTLSATGVATFSSQASASSGSVMLSNADPTLRFVVSGGTADKSKYEWRALAAGPGNDYLQLRKINDANTVFTELLSVANSGLVTIVAGLAGGTSGTGYSFSGSAPATSLTLDSSGNLGIGTPSPTFAAGTGLQVKGAGFTSVRVTQGALTGTDLSQDSSGGYLYVRDNLPLMFGTNNTERARITSTGVLAVNYPTGVLADGNFVVAGSNGTGQGAANTVAQANFIETTSGNAAGLWIGAMTNENTAVIGTRTATGNLAFQTYNVSWGERARLTYDGNLLVGTTSQLGSGKVGFLQSASGQVLVLRSSEASVPYGTAINYTGAAPNNTGSQFIYCDDTGGLRMEVRSNGGIANYSANNVNLSDRREKTNFAPAGSYLDKICAIPVQTFNYFDQNLEQDGGLTLGVVAQDVQAVAPELVMESNWATKDKPEKMRLSIYQTDLQYALMKCIQEQQALITQLTARITALETA